jgi:hypothetical protein
MYEAMTRRNAEALFDYQLSQRLIDEYAVAPAATI